jgi:hypothetical protein
MQQIKAGRRRNPDSLRDGLEDKKAFRSMPHNREIGLVSGWRLTGEIETPYFSSRKKT